MTIRLVHLGRLAGGVGGMESHKNNDTRPMDDIPSDQLSRMLRREAVTIQAILLHMQINQKQAAALLSIDPGGFSKFANGQRRPTTEMCLKFKRRFGVGAGWFIDGSLQAARDLPSGVRERIEELTRETGGIESLLD